MKVLRLTEPRSVSFAEADAQIFFQPGEGGFKGRVVLPVGEIVEVRFADGFRQIFAGVGNQTFPRAQGIHVLQPLANQNLFVQRRSTGANN